MGKGDFFKVTREFYPQHGVHGIVGPLIRVKVRLKTTVYYLKGKRLEETVLRWRSELSGGATQAVCLPWVVFPRGDSGLGRTIVVFVQQMIPTAVLHWLRRGLLGWQGWGIIMREYKSEKVGWNTQRGRGETLHIQIVGLSCDHLVKWGDWHKTLTVLWYGWETGVRWAVSHPGYWCGMKEIRYGYMGICNLHEWNTLQGSGVCNMHTDSTTQVSGAKEHTWRQRVTGKNGYVACMTGARYRGRRYVTRMKGSK